MTTSPYRSFPFASELAPDAVVEFWEAQKLFKLGGSKAEYKFLDHTKVDISAKIAESDGWQNPASNTFAPRICLVLSESGYPIAYANSHHFSIRKDDCFRLVIPPEGNDSNAVGVFETDGAGSCLYVPSAAYSHSDLDWSMFPLFIAPMGLSLVEDGFDDARFANFQLEHYPGPNGRTHYVRALRHCNDVPLIIARRHHCPQYDPEPISAARPDLRSLGQFPHLLIEPEAADALDNVLGEKIIITS